MKYYGIKDIERAYDITRYKLKKLIDRGRLKAEKLRWSRYNREVYKVVISETELKKIDYLKRSEPEYRKENQPGYYERLWEHYDEEDRKFRERYEMRRQKPSYYAYMDSDGWREVRRKRLALDGWKCQACGSVRNLQVHHINYEHLGEAEELYDTVTLCKTCHEGLHRSEQESGLYKMAERYIAQYEYEDAYFYYQEKISKHAPLVSWEKACNIFEEVLNIAGKE